jgi:hypothetical protein
MQESYGEGLASHTGLESCADRRKTVGEALTEVRAGRAIEPRNENPIERWALRSADAVVVGGKPHRARRYREAREDSARSKTPGMHGNISRGSREVPGLPARSRAGCIGKSKDVRR